MQVSISDPVLQTVLVAIVCGIFFVLTFKVKKNYTPHSWTQELKGFAILTIIFAHIGYYLSTDPRFLFPFSILAGVGVNLFFFLSGYGITFSQMKKNESVTEFYKRRLFKLFVPFWTVIAILFTADALILHKTYSIAYMLKACAGIFTSADLYTDLNSPLWYLTLILLYYILFPLFFSRKYPWITAGLLYLFVWSLVKLKLPFLSGVIGLYEVHMLAFPVGVLSAWFIHTQKTLTGRITALCAGYARFGYPLALLVLILLTGYLAIHANVGAKASLEQITSLITMVAVLLIFVIKRRESTLLSLFGLYSYEIYLFHWPLLYRYDIVYKHLPASIATLLYLALFILFSMGLQRLTALISTKTSLSS